MKIFQIGLGSMGKRRIRCAKALGVETILGFDTQADRRIEAENAYGIVTLDSLDQANWDMIDACIISTPPDNHLQYIDLAIEKGLPAFVEASVILAGLPEAAVRAAAKGVCIAPSCTLSFHPAVKDITALIQGGRYGKVTSFSYHTGQYLPDWHPWEAVTDFYVSRPETGGCREIVPFELTWLVRAIGWPDAVTGLYGRTMDVGAPIDDTYAVSMRMGTAIGSLVVDVAARQAVRALLLNLERGQIVWRWEDQCVRLYEVETQRWITYGQPVPQAAAGYNKNIDERMYVEEVEAFFDAARGRATFPNTLDEDIRILRLLEEIEVRGRS
ncbi:MAG: Gfo/Idh/MocA family protein [Desulfovibrio sp.]